MFDAKGLNKTLDVEILAAKNTVTEFVASGDTGGAAVLTNIGADVGFRVTGDTTVANVTTLTQKVAGALTISLDIDETGSAASTTVAGDRDAAVTATNATSIKAVFDSAFIGEASVGTDNATQLVITGTKATSLEVVSGGANASNNLDYVVGAGAVATNGVLTSVTVSGDRALDLDFTAAAGVTASKLATVNASALTGALTFNLEDLAASTGTAFDGGVLTLGSGNDVITGVNGGSIAGLAKGTVEDATAQGTFDVVKLANAVQASDVAATPTYTVKDGLLTFNGSGPATLDAAIALAAQAAESINETVVFEYIGNSYIFDQGAAVGTADDVVIKLVGLTGLKGIDTVGANTDLYVF